MINRVKNFYKILNSSKWGIKSRLLSLYIPHYLAKGITLGKDSDNFSIFEQNFPEIYLVESVKKVGNGFSRNLLNRKKLYAFSSLLSVLLVIINFQACSYSFTGASVPPHLKTIAVPLFNDRSGTGEFNVSEKFTNSLVQKFIDDNSLLIADRTNADALLEGTIVSLTDNASVVTGTETISTRRITINVRVVYRDLIKRQTILERTFSNYADYPTDGDITKARQEAIEGAIENITQDILLAVVSNW